jgi:hypothetical protein
MPDRGRLLGRALGDTEGRSIDCIFRLLGLIFPRQDIAKAQAKAGGRQSGLAETTVGGSGWETAPD